MAKKYLTFFLLFITVAYSRYAARDVSNPRAFPEQCVSQQFLNNWKQKHPNDQLPSSWICDPEGYLDSETYFAVNDKITKLRKDTDAEIGVIIVDV